MKMLFEIGKTGGDPVEYVKALLGQKKKVFGFGHRRLSDRGPARDAPAEDVRSS